LRKRPYFILLLLFLHGCATVSLFRQPVDFKDPYKQLDIVSVEPTEEGKAGVVLRLTAPASGVNKHREETVVFSQIVDEKGIKFSFDTERTDTYKKGSHPDSYIVRFDTKIKMGGGKLFSELEMSDRGQIIRFIPAFVSFVIVKAKNGKATAIENKIIALFLAYYPTTHKYY
jgi:hypothetical protein